MSQIKYSPEAEADLVGIVSYIARDKPEAARRWVSNIRQVCEVLATQPEAGELRLDVGVVECRAFSVGNYVVFFRSTESGIEVARVIHGSRDLRNL